MGQNKQKHQQAFVAPLNWKRATDQEPFLTFQNIVSATDIRLQRATENRCWEKGSSTDPLLKKFTSVKNESKWRLKGNKDQ